MPASARDAFGEALHRFHPDAAAEQFVAAYAADSGCIEHIELRLINVGLDDCDATQPMRVASQRFDKEPIVRSVYAHLHQHTTLDAKRVVHRQISFLGCGRGRVAAFGSKGITFRRADYVRMAIAGAGGRTKTRSMGMRVWALAGWRLQTGRGRFGHRCFLVGA